MSRSLCQFVRLPGGSCPKRNTCLQNSAMSERIYSRDNFRNTLRTKTIIQSAVYQSDRVGLTSLAASSSPLDTFSDRLGLTSLAVVVVGHFQRLEGADNDWWGLTSLAAGFSLLDTFSDRFGLTSLAARVARHFQQLIWADKSSGWF
ncbi:hypothetical protein MAR_035770 [Mya arenaria]|uniref:Uncharacterized protein n=1 Tax=Mya arenaria TaxID=6604 RepID=A0ABY7ENN5_MYAAR|nr:hypothetical protein MAR_035770 [Mya arenaria]